MQSLKTKQNNSTLEDFVILTKIGQGSFSQVHKVRRIEDGKIYALKKIQIDRLKPKEKELTMNEVRILASLTSPFIISYREAFYHHQQQQLCLIMEWANEGDLWKEIELYSRNQERIPESQIWRAVRDILIAIDTLHRRSIMHRDIKSENIFKSEGYYKLGDLNIAKICHSLAKTQIGTPFYASPEVWNQQPYDFKSDIWSFGCVLYQICQLESPFKGTSPKEVHSQVISGKVPTISKIYSQEMQRIISLCLKVNPQQRLKAHEILELPWVKQKLKQNRIQCKLHKQTPTLLKTITVPTDLKKLTEILPKPNYPIKKRHKFILSKNKENRSSLGKKFPTQSVINKEEQKNAEEKKEKKFFFTRRRNLKSAGNRTGEKQTQKTQKKRPISAVSLVDSQKKNERKYPNQGQRHYAYSPQIVRSLQIRKHKMKIERSFEQKYTDFSRRKEPYSTKQKHENKDLWQKISRKPLSSVSNRLCVPVMPYMMKPYEVPRIRQLASRDGNRLKRQIGKLYHCSFKDRHKYGM